MSRWIRWCNRLVTVYRLVEGHEGGNYGRPEISEMKGSLAIGVLSDVTVDWTVFPN